MKEGALPVLFTHIYSEHGTVVDKEPRLWSALSSI
jgi:hypothetical protein